MKDNNEEDALKKIKIDNGSDPLNMFKTEKEIEREREKELRKKELEELKQQSLISTLPKANSILIPDDEASKKMINSNQTINATIQNKNQQQNRNLKEKTKIDEFFKYEQQQQQKIKPDVNPEKTKIEKSLELMTGETLKEYQKASFNKYDNTLIGILGLTNGRLIFRFDNEDNYLKMKLYFHPNYFHIPLFQIEKILKVQEREGIFSYPIDIILKDTRVLRFHIWDRDSIKFYNALNDAALPRDPNSYFNFTSDYMKALKEENKLPFNGWNLYNPLQEYHRQGITEDNDLNLRFCNANQNFNLCPTYPRLLVVHNELNDDQIRDASNHRTKNRLPVLSYYYGRNKNKNIKACPSIWRSSQTKSGLRGKKSNSDILLLEKITKLCAKLYIFDARPYINALANRVNGGGFENVDHYSNVDMIFCEIDNIHVARTSLIKLYQLCLSNKIMDNQKFWSSLEATGWYSFIHLLLKYANEIGLTLQKNYSVLIHCSDGWDRSSQLISLSQILVDPYFRTIKGLACLIEKDWLSFGHQFGLRNGIYFKEVSEAQNSPIFLQFLDCLHQLLIQFPNAFEFNDEFLLFLANNYNSNIYGTFMFNSEKERMEKNASTNSVSVWTDVFNNITRFRNVYFNSENSVEVLNPNYAPYNLVPWINFFIQYNTSIENRSFYLSDSEYMTTFKNNREFFEFHKRMDILKYSNFELKYDHLVEIMTEINKATKNSEVFKLYNESTQKCLLELDSIEKQKEKEKTKKKQKENNTKNEKVQILESKSEIGEK